MARRPNEHILLHMLQLTIRHPDAEAGLPTPIVAEDQQAIGSRLIAALRKLKNDDKVQVGPLPFEMGGGCPA